jgi:hypothetical protein
VTDLKEPPLSLTEMHVFGFDAQRHPLFGFVIEQGSGALPVEQQAENHIRAIERAEGPDAAVAARRRLAIYHGAAPTLVK